MFFTEVTGNRVSDHDARNIQLYEGLSKNSCSVDLIDTKNTLKQQIYSKITTISVVQVFNLELVSLAVSFSRIFSIH